MIGAGTVGGGVYEIIMNRLGGSSSTETPIITKICVRDANKPRDFSLDTSLTTIVTNVESILNDDEIDMVVEVAGGVTFAKDAVYKALKSSKSVVTANKALIAENLEEIVSMVNDTNSKKKSDMKLVFVVAYLLFIHCNHVVTREILSIQLWEYATEPLISCWVRWKMGMIMTKS